jgi:serine/threonine protein kinase
VKDLVLLEELEKLLLRRYFRDVIAGLMYLHSHNIVHGDIKPENLLIDSNGRTKFCDFSVSRSFEDDNDELRRSPGTPVFIATERCLGLTYQEKLLLVDKIRPQITLMRFTQGITLFSEL